MSKSAWMIIMCPKRPALIQWIKYLLHLSLGLCAHAACAQKILNVYAWGGEIPSVVVAQFEKKTGIKVNFSTYDSNETMYAKLRASRNTIYDVVIPSSYYIERMQKQNMLTPLNLARLPNIKNIEPFFIKSSEINKKLYGIPLIWGATGIFTHHDVIKPALNSWQDLWELKQPRQLMLLDDPREIFSITLMSLGYPPMDENKAHIEQAYQKLLTLIPFIKLFASEGIQALLIDGDAMVGTAWNGDVFKAQAENPSIRFFYPKEGFVIWVDNVAILNHAPHPIEAYAFINFLLEADMGRQIALKEGHAITNRASIAQLPQNIRTNPLIYPSTHTLARAYIQHDLSDAIMALYHERWEALKLSF